MRVAVQFGAGRAASGAMAKRYIATAAILLPVLVVALTLFKFTYLGKHYAHVFYGAAMQWRRCSDNTGPGGHCSGLHQVVPVPAAIKEPLAVAWCLLCQPLWATVKVAFPSDVYLGSLSLLVSTLAFAYLTIMRFHWTYAPCSTPSRELSKQTTAILIALFPGFAIAFIHRQLLWPSEPVWPVVRSAWVNLFLFSLFHADRIVSSASVLKQATSSIGNKVTAAVRQSLRRSVSPTLATTVTLAGLYGVAYLAMRYLPPSDKFANGDWGINSNMGLRFPTDAWDFVALLAASNSTMPAAFDLPKLFLLTMAYPLFLNFTVIVSLELLLTVALYHPLDFSKLSSPPPSSSSYAVESSLINALTAEPLISKDDGVHQIIENWVNKLPTRPRDPSGPPVWAEILRLQRGIADSFLNIPVGCTGPLRVKALSSGHTTHAALLRSLALQDLARVARGSRYRRISLITGGSGRDWHLVGMAACAAIDAVTIQLQLCTAHMIEEVLRRPGGSGTNNAKSPSGVTWEALDLARKNRLWREEQTLWGQLARALLTVGIIRGTFVESWLHWLTGASLPTATGTSELLLPTFAVQDALHAMDSVSLVLQTALVEDGAGTVQRHLPASLHSLLGLELAVKDYGDALREAYASTQRRHLYLAMRKRPGQLVPDDVLALAVAADEAVNRIVRAYKDVIPSIALSATYAELLQIHFTRSSHRR